MSTQASAAIGMKVKTNTVSWVHAFYWCVRRELWEYKAIYVGPVAAAGVYLLGFLLTLHRIPHQMREAMADPTKLKAIGASYEFAAVAIMLVAMIVEIFYCVDALQGERKDRSILFWKSLPVSDLTTILSKAAIPFVILPAVAYGVLIVAAFVMLVLSSMVLKASGLSAGPLWTQLSLFSNAWGLLYHMVTVHVLWYAPLYCWMLLVSAWARRAAFVWAFLPPFCVGMLEKIVFGTMHFAEWIGYRVGGGMEAEQGSGTMPSTHLTPLRFLSAPGLWFGWIAAAIFLTLAVRIRRNREPS